MTTVAPIICFNNDCSFSIEIPDDDTYEARPPEKGSTFKAFSYGLFVIAQLQQTARNRNRGFKALSAHDISVHLTAHDGELAKQVARRFHACWTNARRTAARGKTTTGTGTTLEYRASSNSKVTVARIEHRRILDAVLHCDEATNDGLPVFAFHETTTLRLPGNPPFRVTLEETTKRPGTTAAPEPDANRDQVFQACERATRIRIIAATDTKILDLVEQTLSHLGLTTRANLQQLRLLLLDPQSPRLSRPVSDNLKSRHEVLCFHLTRIRKSSSLTNESGSHRLPHIPLLDCICADSHMFTVDSTGTIIVTDLSAHVLHRFDTIFNYEAPSAHDPDKDWMISAGGSVHTRIRGKTHIVLAQRTDGSYVFPKGHRHHDEDPDNLTVTARREIARETGLDAVLLNYEEKLGTYEEALKWDPTLKKTVHIYSFSYGGDVTTLRLLPCIHHREARWFPIDNLPENLKYPDQIAMLADFLEANQ